MFIPCILHTDSVNNEDEPTKLFGDDIITTVPEPSEKAPSESSSNERKFEVKLIFS